MEITFLKDGVKQNKQQIKNDKIMNLATLHRYKKTTPFSNRLNDFTCTTMEQYTKDGIIGGIDFTDQDGYDTFESIKEYYNKTHRLIIWTGGSDCTVFGDPKVNHMFRAWHDLTHILNGFDFTPEGESMTAFKQISLLPWDWGFERQLILVEVIGQVLYHAHHKDFPVDQRAFALGYMGNGDITIKY